MDQKTPTVKKQMSSSLRERLKKCGRYHASPKSDSSPGTNVTSIANSKQPAKSSTLLYSDKEAHTDEKTNSFISPLSRKRCSTNSLDDEVIFKRLHSDMAIQRNTAQKENTKQELPESEENVNDNNNAPELKDIDQPIDVNKTPLTSRSRLKYNTLKSNRLTFQNESCSQESKLSNIPRDSSQLLAKETKENHALPDTSSGLRKEIEEKEEKLRKLKMVKTYRTKNDLTELQALIDKWRQVSQQALQDLHSEMLDPKPTLAQLVDHLGIEHELLNFDAEEETFD